LNTISVLRISVICLFLFVGGIGFAQQSQNDRTFYKPTTTYAGEPDTILTMDVSNISKPNSLESFNPLFHFPPVRQDTTGTCWSFATISFLETELVRLGKEKAKLSEMFVAYYEYVEKARAFVKTMGETYFDEGSEEISAIERIKQYGIVRASDYSGKLPGQIYYGHGPMFEEIENYLHYIMDYEYWDEDMVVENVKMILNKYMGKPPEKVKVKGKVVIPLEYATKILQLPLNDYVDIMSFTYAPFYTQAEYKVPDNWWHCKDYYNVPLDEWYEAVKTTIKNGYSISIGGDVSEVGKIGGADIAIIPEFDIPVAYINQDARELRFDNETSEDDHLIHLIGYQHFDGYDWFLVKDSGYSATKGTFKGYYFFREDFVKLKMLTFMVHKDAVKELLKKF